MRKKQIKNPTDTEVKAFIENRSYVKKGEIILDRIEYENFKKTHCFLCAKETREGIKHFGEITCRACKEKLDPNDEYKKMKLMGSNKWKLS